MKAILDLQDRLVWTDVPELKAPQDGEILVRVVATAVNRADLAQRAGKYPPPPGVTEVLGLECSGIVEELGSGVTWPAIGDHVCCLLSGGGYAEHVVLPASHALPVPTGVPLHQAAALPEVFTTAWLNLREEGELSGGERVLVHAGASGVGTAAVQLCQLWGCPTFVTVGSERKEKFCRGLGADATASRFDGPWGLKVKAWGGADVILDPVGGAYLESNIHALNPGGRLVNIGVLGGVEGTLPMGRLLVKRQKVVGSVLRSRSVEEKARILAAMKREIWASFASGMLRPIVHQSFPITEVENAHHLLKSNSTIGKILLTVE